MISRNAVLIATLAAMTFSMSTSSWGQTNNSSIDPIAPQDSPATNSQNVTPPDQAAASSGEPTQQQDSAGVKSERRGQLRPRNRLHRAYPLAYRSGRAYYPYSGYENYFGGGFLSGYSLGSTWINPNLGNHGGIQSGYNLGPVRVNPNYGNSW